MKVLLVVMLLSLLIPQPTRAQSDEDCTSEAVAEWMIQRQVGYSRIETLIEYGAESFLDGLLMAQEVRRELEDLPRPACADALFMLTINYYNGVADSMAFSMAENDVAALRVMETRTSQYEASVGEIYTQLEAIAGIDAMMAAANIQIVPTATPVWPPAEEIALANTQGGILEAPVTIPPGAYRLRFESFGGRGLTAEGNTVTGYCDSFYIFTTSDVRVTERFFRSEGCEIAFSISMSDMGWTLSLTPIE